MQRSITHKKPLAPLFYITAFVIYQALSSVYLFLPPLLGVLFVMFAQSLKRKDGYTALLIGFCLVVFEADKGYTLFSSVIYFFILYKFILPKLIQNFSCHSCLQVTYILLAYLGYYAFSILLANIFLLPLPEINYYIVYYIVIEFLIVSVL
jgi:hypothetical protein